MSFQLIGQTDFYRGKVRDVYFIGNDWLVMAASDRISAFDVILPKLIPFKGQVLNEIAAYMLQQTADICPNWLVSVPAPFVSIGKRCAPFRVEMVVRGNLTGHAWRTYQSGKKSLCGIPLPNGMRENDFFKDPIITPSTKAVEGHDEDISREEIIAQGIVPTNYYDLMEAYSLALFERGRTLAKDKGLILVDTKYEFGLLNDEVVLMDEIHTPDSSRYFYADDFEKKQAIGEKQQQLSKEFVREWLISHDFMGKEGQIIPEMTEDWVEVISKRYIALYEKLTGLTFYPVTQNEMEVQEKINNALTALL